MFIYLHIYVHHPDGVARQSRVGPGYGRNPAPHDRKAPGYQPVPLPGKPKTA